MSTFLWPADDGWPYPDAERDQVDLDSDVDDDLMSLKAPPPHLFDALDPLEREVLTARFGLHGAPIQSMKELHSRLGVSREELRLALGSGLAKLRAQLKG